MNNEIEKITFKNNLEKLENLGYSLNPNVTEKNLYNLYYEFILLFTNLPSFEFQIQNRISPLYYHFGGKFNTEDYFSNNCLWWDLENFDIDGKTEYVVFMQRMSLISRGELAFENITCYKIQNGLDDQANIEFEVNGIKKLWNIKYGYQDVFIQRFALLCEELKTTGKYTIYDDGSQSFVLDYGTEEEVKKFNKVTGLVRKFLKDTNHFGRPTD